MSYDYHWFEITVLLLIGLVAGIGVSMFVYCYKKHRCFCNKPPTTNFIAPALSFEYLPQIRAQEKPYFELCLSDL